MMRVYVPADATASALDADQVAARVALAGHEVVRRGSRGLFFLEPLVEIEIDGAAIGFGPVRENDVDGLIAALASGDPTAHELCVGPIHAHPYLAGQVRETFRRAGEVLPGDPADYERLGGFAGLRRALVLGAEGTLGEVEASGLRGRGGAGFPAHIKWRTVADTPAPQKYVVCNADEGDSGTFADRLLIETDPLQLIEGMAIAGVTTGATQGYIYLRSEYPAAATVLTYALARAREHGALGIDVFGSGQHFDIDVRIGAGAYICGEETSLLESLEGKRGVIRAKPPLPAISGLFKQPTLVHNVLTLAATSTVLAAGGAHYEHFGVGRSRGTMPFQLGGNVLRGGLVEVPFGLTLRDLVMDYGGGTRSGRPIKAVQVGGPLGRYLPESALDVVLGYEELAAGGGLLGHGGVVVFDDTADMGAMARFAFEFCAEESCGKCTPCRVGAVRGVEVVDKIRSDEDPEANRIVLTDLCDTMEGASLCLMGGMTPNPVRSVLEHFPDEL
jgi:formate dehydrogenase iron-sulfur subunit